MIDMKNIPGGAMSRLFIIGNGFDLAHGVPSSYVNFKEYVDGYVGYMLETYINKKWWKDFEENLARINLKIIFNDENIMLKQPDPIECNTDEGSGAYDALWAEEVGRELRLLYIELKREFADWIKQLDAPKTELKYIDLITNSKVLNFNYTEFIETLYGVDHENVCYIHGCRLKDDEYVLGHNSSPSSADSTGLSPLGNYILCHNQHIVYEYIEETMKNTKKYIEENRAFFDSLADKEQIIVIGHSLSSVDYVYFKEIIKVNASAKWYLGVHSDNDKENISQFIEMIGIGKDQYELFKI